MLIDLDIQLRIVEDIVLLYIFGDVLFVFLLLDILFQRGDLYSGYEFILE